MAEIPSVMRRRRPLAVTASVGGVAMAVAGLLHLGLAPLHLEHSVEHGLALFAVGAADVVWTSVWLQRLSRATAQTGIALGLASLYLYSLTRALPLPFEGRPEPVDGFGMATQLSEAVAFVSLTAFALMSGTSARRLAALSGSAIGGASVLLAAASCASLVLGSGP